MWVLVAIMLTAKGVGVQPVSPYKTMEECFDAREQYMFPMPKPKINYEMVCVRTDLLDEV